MVTGRWIGRRAFGRDRRGNVGMMWALMGTVLLGLVGLTVDFTRAQMIRTQMQNAADGAALVAERSSNLSMDERTAAARAFFDAELGEALAARVGSFNVVQLEDGGHRVEAIAPLDVTLGRLVRNSDWNVAVAAEAQANASPPIEVALVLDNTGSMANDMQSLRAAASDLVSDLMSLDGDTVRVALVPFVAQVNIGNQNSHLAWMDTTGVAPLNGEILEDRMIGNVRRRTNASNANYTGSNCEALSDLPYFDNPSTGANEGYPGPYRVRWVRSGNRCYAVTPEDGVNYFTLFDLISNVSWGGCVEARPMPYDANDAAPVIGTPATLFVPYFWMDTGGSANQSNSSSSSNINYRNNNQSYLDDEPGTLYSATAANVNAANGRPPTSQWNDVVMSTGNGGSSPSSQDEREAHFFNVFKYRGGSASIDTTYPDTRGPNRGCPTPIVPLTTNETLVQTNVAAMRHWMGGGTNQAEGLAWGWRVLSPTAPFTEGEPYGPEVRKVIVLMSDGENTNVGTDAVMEGDYSAFNYLGFWEHHASGNLLTQLLFGVLHGVLPAQFRRNISSSNQYVDHVNARQREVCDNIKAEGIEIYVVRFRNGDANTMRSCASDDAHYFSANNAAELSAAFDAIGTGIGALRLTR